MYEMYPEWGPARNNPDSPYSQQAQQQALQKAFDQRDEAGDTPDDN